MKPLVFPPLTRGKGRVVECRLTPGQDRHLRRVAEALGVRVSKDGGATVGALIRALGSGALRVSRAPGDEAGTDEGPAMGGCPRD